MFVGLIAAGLCGGAVVGALITLATEHRKIRRATLRAQARRDEAARQSAERLTEGRRLAAEKRALLNQRLEAEIEREENTQHEYEGQLDDREAWLNARRERIDEDRAEVQAIADESEALEQTTAALGQRLREVHDSIAEALAEQAAVNIAELTKQHIEESTGQAALQRQMFARRTEDHISHNAVALSRRTLATVVDRYNGISHIDRVQNTFPTDGQRALQALADPHGEQRAAFIEYTACDIVSADDGATLCVRSEDPLAREVGRRAVNALQRGRRHDVDAVRRAAQQVRGDVEREVQQAGREAAKLFAIEKLHPDILNLLGRLKYRLSYSQNQWRHAVEVAHLAGLLADEMRLDVRLAQRAGLLHDIGKSMTHDHDGSHAVLGAQIARRCDENEYVANAIGAHHHDEPANSPYALLVGAADALSGGRPGARRESSTTYFERIRELQNIATRSPLVERVDIMLGGREVRVFVAGADFGDDAKAPEAPQGAALTDSAMHELAQDIVHDIESELTYAGQIRVTVIRESQSIAVAH